MKKNFFYFFNIYNFINIFLFFKVNKKSVTKLIFGSSTPRDLSYLNKIPYKHRIYNAEIPKPVIITNPSPSNKNKYGKHSLSKDVRININKYNKKNEKNENKLELNFKDFSQKIKIQMNGSDEDNEDDKSLSPYSEPDLSNDHFHYLSLPLSNTNSHRSLNDNFFKDLSDKEHLNEKTAPLEMLFISQCNHPAYNIHDSPLKEQLLLNDKSKFLLNDSQQILFDHNFDECEEKIISKTSDIKSLREEMEKIKYNK
ncbi:Hypothetical protein SRAE_2000098900 [Strongyloides ratti]|uniref:Uncharacterized protein n=1 Tax=Strongyloides ratti TaxID=34506 RepID=A0A090MY00_STRRB|nr:Hypothetical protein SRAE_2000098900 [Strongyloides ratti]CEF66319.1 Hypothetical protein SRAE_2000098900 [Strongyloides ratti]